MRGRCRGTKKDGERCNSWALSGSEYCWFHDPELAEERKAARRRGGANSRIYNRQLRSGDIADVEFKLRDLRDLSGFLEFLINQAFQRRIDTKLANTLGYLITVQKSCIESSEIERRLEKLEEVVLSVKH